MTVFVKIDLPTSNEPKPQWLNQLRVTLSMGKRYEQKHDLEKATNCYETVLFYNPTDTRTRIRLSRCYQRILRLEQAVKHQIIAMQDDPHLFITDVNESSIKSELGNFESSLIGYIRCFKQWKLSPNCNQGLLKINQIMENVLPTDGIIRCLGATILKMIEDDDKFNESTAIYYMFDKINKLEICREPHIERIQEANYLRYIIENVEFYKKELSDLPKLNIHDKLIQEQFQEIVHTFKKVKNDLYQKNPFYMFPCQRPNFQLSDRQKVRDMIKLQISKYVNTVVKHCLAGEIRSAQQQAELALNYMNKRRYRPLMIVNTLYEVLGLAMYLVNQDMPEWSNEINEKRILFILGADTHENDSYKRVYQESYFGSCDVYNTRNTLKKFNKQLKQAELSTYNLYLQHERIKCYITQNEFSKIRPLSKQMFTDACTLGSIAWQVNALMMTVISESRLGHAPVCMETLELIIPVSRTLGSKNVTHFMRKIWKLFAEDRVNVHVMGSDEMRRADLVNIMPDTNTALYMRKLLHSIKKLPQS